MQQSCTRDKGNYFFTSQQGGGERNGGGGRGEGGEGGEQTPEGGGRDQNYNVVFRSNATIFMGQSNCLFPVNEEVEEEEITATMHYP